MRFTKVFRLLAMYVVLSGLVEARKYLDYLPEPLLRDSTRDAENLPIVVPLSGGRYVWFDKANSVAFLRSQGGDHFLAGRIGNGRIHPGVGGGACFGTVQAAVAIPGTDDVLILASSSWGNASVLRLSLDGRVTVERQLANPDTVYDYGRAHLICFQCENDGTVYCSNNWTRLYRFKLGVPEVDFCDLPAEARIELGGLIPRDSNNLLVASPSVGFIDSSGTLEASGNPSLVRLEFDWARHALSLNLSAEGVGTAPNGYIVQSATFAHDGNTGRSFAYCNGSDSSGTLSIVALYSVSDAGKMELVRTLPWAFMRFLPSNGDIVALTSGVPASLYQFRDGVPSFETSFGADTTPADNFRARFRKVVSSGGNLFYSFQVGDSLRMLPPSGKPKEIALGERPSYGDMWSLFFTNLPATFDIAGDGQGGAYVTYFGINAVYHVLPNGEQKRWVGAGVVNTMGDSGSVSDGPVEIAGVRFPSCITTLSDRSVVFVDDRNLRRIYGGVVTTLGDVDQGDSLDGPLSSARWTHVVGLAGGPDGSLYAIDGSCIRKVDSNRQVTTVAGVASEARLLDGSRETARFEFPMDLAVDSQGTLFVLDNGALRVVEPDGTVSTLQQCYSDVSFASRLGNASALRTLSLDDSGNLVLGGDDVRVATVGDTEREPLQLENFSARGRRGERENSLTLGFSARGDSVSLLVRGVGPTLGDFGVTEAAQHAGVRLLEADGAVAKENDGWSSTIGAETLPEYIDKFLTFQNQHFRQLGAFALREDRHEGALVQTVAEGSGFVTLQSLENEAEGVALLEVYNEFPTAEKRLTNCSIRGLAGGSSGALVGGFVLEGQGTKKVLARVSGPALKGFGLSGALAHPKLRFYNHGRLVAEKSGWENDAAVAQAISQTGAFAYSHGSEDCALVLDLPAGNYTVEAESTDGGSGVALVEIYVVP